MFIYTLFNILTHEYKTVVDEDIATLKEICEHANLSPSEWKIWDTIDPKNENALWKNMGY